jgi:hypothetical protein
MKGKAMSNLETLQHAGVAVEELSAEQKAVLSALSDQEIALLSGIKARLDGASGDVEAHTEVIGGVIF